MSFEDWIIETLPPWVIKIIPSWVFVDAWLPHFALVAALLGLWAVPRVIRLIVIFGASLAQLMFAALLAILPAAARGLGLILPALWSASARLVLLVWFLVLEATGREASWTEDEADDENEPVERPDVAAACALLGLPTDGFGPDELKRAYRQAMKRAHPDQGGSAAATAAVIEARAVIINHFGWQERRTA